MRGHQIYTVTDNRFTIISRLVCIAKQSVQIFAVILMLDVIGDFLCAVHIVEVTDDVAEYSVSAVTEITEQLTVLQIDSAPYDSVSCGKSLRRRRQVPVLF